MNPKQHDVMHQVLELATTALAGLEYVETKNRTGDFESAAYILTDVISSFAQVQEVLPIVGFDDDKSVQAAIAPLQEGFRRYLECIEANDYATLLDITQGTLLPCYKTWKRALEQAVHLRITST